MRLPVRFLYRWRIGLLCVCLGGAWAAAGRTETPAAAQEPWTQPIALFDTTGFASRPVVIADPVGDVHLFFMVSTSKDLDVQAQSGQPPLPSFQAPPSPQGSGTQSQDRGTPGALMYARLHDGRWSAPLDVLVSPDGGLVNLPAVTLDQNGLLHVVWQGGLYDQIYYSRAHVSQADSVWGWRRPIVLSDGSGLSSDIVASRDGALHFVYASRDGNVYYRRSNDGGDTWTGQVTVSANQGTNEATDLPRIAADERGRLHVVWTQFQLPKGWPPFEAFYSRSLDGGGTWADPLRIAGQSYGYINLAVSGPDTIHLVWGSTADVGERKHQWSGDGGASWSPAHDLASKVNGAFGGFTGYSVMALDSAGVLHLVTSVNGHGGTTEDVYHVAWNGAAWGDPTLLSAGAAGRRSVEYPWIAVSAGNRLHVVYEDDFEHIWYTTRVVDAPPLAPEAVPPPAATVTPAPPPAPALPSPTTSLLPVPATRADPGDRHLVLGVHPLLLGLVPSLLITGAMLLPRLSRLTQR